MRTYASYKEFVHAVDHLVNDTVIGKYPQSWDEDHITYSLVDAFCARFPRVTVHGLRDALSCRWEAFKLKGHAEQAFGDLAVLIAIRSKTVPLFAGVGLLEAKRRFSGGKFDSAKVSQLEWLAKKAPLF